MFKSKACIVAGVLNVLVFGLAVWFFAAIGLISLRWSLPFVIVAGAFGMLFMWFWQNRHEKPFLELAKNLPDRMGGDWEIVEENDAGYMLKRDNTMTFIGRGDSRIIKVKRCC